MNLKFENLNDLETKMRDSEKYITSCQEICDSLAPIIERYAKNTALQRLSNFQKIIYYANSSIINPFYKTDLQSIFPTDDLMTQIHCRMFRFLKERKILILKDRNCSVFSDYVIEYTIPHFSWKIPSVFMPFLAAYISACSPKVKEGLTPDIFFSHFSSYFSRAIYLFQAEPFSYISTDLANKIESICQEWCDVYLGRSYFTNLTDLLKQFKNNKDEKLLVMHSIQPITNVLMNSPIEPNPIPYYANLLLEQHRKEIRAHDNQELFPHLVPWEIQNEMEIVKGFFEEFIVSYIEPLCNSVTALLEEYHINDSKYELAVRNYDAFNDEITTILNQVSVEKENVKRNFCRFFKQSNADPFVQKGVADNILSINIPNERKHLETFWRIIDKLFLNTCKEVETFLKLVNQSSSKHPERYKKISPEKKYLSAFSENISVHIENCRKDLKTKGESLPAPFYYHEKGLIQEISYSLCFSENDIFNILSILIPQNKIPSLESPKEYILDVLNKEGFEIPMTPQELAHLFLRLEKLFHNS